MKNRTLISKLKGHFTKLPNRLLRLPNLSSDAKFMFWVMAAQAEEFNPHVKFLCEQTGKSKPTVLKILKELQSRNIIKKYKQGYKGSPSLYEFINPKDWR